MLLYITLLLNGLGGIYFLFCLVEWYKTSHKEEEALAQTLALAQTQELKKEEEPYEKKYMKKYQNASRDIVLTEDEKEEWGKEYKKKIDKTKKDIVVMKRRLLYYEKEGIQDLDRIQERMEALEKEVEEPNEDTMKESVLEKRKEKLKHSILIEKTPLGNVILFYDHKRETFAYYSDNTIPYRFLETVARKYVTMFHCKYLYVDMEEELLEAQKKRDEKKTKEEEEKKKRLESNETEKKNVFAKFKSYNKEGIKTAGIAKNNQTSTSNQKKEDPDALLKENANRYTWEGRFLDCKVLQKVDRKITDKRLGTSFSEFKRMRYSG
jgi:hypothetical protein